MKRTLKIFSNYNYGQGTRKSFIIHFYSLKMIKTVDNIIMKYYLVMVSSCQKYVVTHDACRPLFTLSLIFTTRYVITFRHFIFLIAIVLQFEKKLTKLGF